ncbi:hypothetical protein CYMTET_32087 [Cymbomonas tetramitiformis]|uniref:Cyclic nucleotide-binding domain-containing protein n=1 Tax=Cymbomonas tetramitiformis TaxID=36881 RepID=A0AAE0FFI5_9CHLO|nr:hypothetical protein CYMTET_32087 [Cymbomonas tetramitiformis]
MLRDGRVLESGSDAGDWRVGYGDILPATVLERMWTCWVYLIGAIIYSTIFANVAMILQNMEQGGIQYQNKIDSINEVLRFHEVPEGLASTVHKNVDYAWAMNSGIQLQDILQMLPYSLRAEVCLVLYKGVLRKVPVFRTLTRPIMQELALAMRPQSSLPGEFIFREGDVGDFVYIVGSGTLYVTNFDGSKAYCKISSGQIFGENILFSSCRRTGSVRAASHCQLYSISKTCFLQLLDVFPDSLKTLLKGSAATVVTKRSRRRMGAWMKKSPSLVHQNYTLPDDADQHPLQTSAPSERPQPSVSQDPRIDYVPNPKKSDAGADGRSMLSRSSVSPTGPPVPDTQQSEGCPVRTQSSDSSLTVQQQPGPAEDLPTEHLHEGNLSLRDDPDPSATIFTTSGDMSAVEISTSDIRMAIHPGHPGLKLHGPGSSQRNQDAAAAVAAEEARLVAELHAGVGRVAQLEATIVQQIAEHADSVEEKLRSLAAHVSDVAHPLPHSCLQPLSA